MNCVRWILLGVVFVLYLLLGGSIFMVLEQENELKQHQQLQILRKDIQEILLGLDKEFYNNGTSSEILDAIRAAKEGVLERISETCKGNHLLVDGNNGTDPLRWTFYNSVFFAFTAITTIGYGNLAPDTQWSRIFTIIYALIGIPLNGIILAKISDSFNRKLVKLNNPANNKTRLTFVINITLYLLLGLLLFILIPAGFFVVIENWGYLDAIYFCFVTLTTIGFGDYVAGMGDGHNIWLWIYKIMIIFWIVFGLAYLVMIFGFISKGITSKNVRLALEKKLHKIRITREKFACDVERLRNVVNELSKHDGSIMEGNGVQFLVEQSSNGSLMANFEDEHHIRINRSQSFYIPRDSIESVVDMALIRSFSESDMDRFNNNMFSNSLPKFAKGQKIILEQLMSSLPEYITDLLDAVENLHEDFDTEVYLTEVRTDPHVNTEALNVMERSDKRYSWPHDSARERDVANLMENQSDLVSLDQVIIHDEFRPGVTILNKVAQVLRKISSGNKMSHSEPTSQKVSQTHSENKFQHPQFYICEKDGVPSIEPFLSAQIPCTSEIEYGQMAESKRNSFAEEVNRQSVTSVDSKHLLAEFLKVLDGVHERIKDCENAESESFENSGITNEAFLGSNPSSPVAIRKQRDICEKDKFGRRRKVGIYDPEFTYVQSPHVVTVGTCKTNLDRRNSRR